MKRLPTVFVNLYLNLIIIRKSLFKKNDSCFTAVFKLNCDFNRFAQVSATVYIAFVKARGQQPLPNRFRVIIKPAPHYNHPVAAGARPPPKLLFKSCCCAPAPPYRRNQILTRRSREGLSSARLTLRDWNCKRRLLSACFPPPSICSCAGRFPVSYGLD
jgi:hypothetical protein